MGRIVFITGGGTGLGFANATEFCRLGDHVCISGRRENVLQKACDLIRGSVSGAKIFYVVMDVRKVEQVEAGIDKIIEVAGDLPSIILNNAAGNFVSPTEFLSANAWRSIVEIVFLGGVNVITGVGKRWIKRRENGYDGDHSPQVVFYSVGASYMPTGAAFLAPSAASKAAIFSLHQSLASEWGKYNMRFVMVSPGPIYTEGAFSRLDPMGMSPLSDHKNKAAVGKGVPSGFMPDPQEYAKFVAFICSDACRWLNGTNIHYDGGSFANGGEFKSFNLREVTRDEWKMMAATIKKTSAKQKKGEVETMRKSKL